MGKILTQINDDAVDDDDSGSDNNGRSCFLIKVQKGNKRKTYF